jgi:hypothetical protein
MPHSQQISANAHVEMYMKKTHTFSDIVHQKHKTSGTWLKYMVVTLQSIFSGILITFGTCVGIVIRSFRKNEYLWHVTNICKVIQHGSEIMLICLPPPLDEKKSGHLHCPT